MTFRVTLKDPDTLHDAIRNAVEKELPTEGLDTDEVTLVREARADKISKLCCRLWFEYGEYLTVEVDTEEKTCTVVESGRSSI